MAIINMIGDALTGATLFFAVVLTCKLVAKIARRPAAQRDQLLPSGVTVSKEGKALVITDTREQGQRTTTAIKKDGSVSTSSEGSAKRLVSTHGQNVLPEGVSFEIAEGKIIFMVKTNGWPHLRVILRENGSVAVKGGSGTLKAKAKGNARVNVSGGDQRIG